MTRTDFAECLKFGENGESLLDKYFSKEWNISSTSRQQQQQGIDRVFIRTNERYAIEYKTDSIAAGTGNAFLEISIFAKPHKPGWVYTCTADFLFYFVLDSTVYIVRPNKLRLHIDRWIATYPLKKVQTHGHKKYQNYQTQGVLVPLEELAKIGKVIEI